MWRKFETWQIAQLGRLANIDLERAESVLNTVWSQYPGLYEQMALLALDQKQLEVEQCAKLLNVDEAECVERLQRLRGTLEHRDAAGVVIEPGQAAKVAGGSVAVWEIVREYRKIGSVERLVESFPSLSTNELVAALNYARQHPDEIEELISKYEAALERRRMAYPFATQAS